ncbi:MAG: hypothetical protein C3F13_08300 [Anaerolineales bacterium]|nr:MAG: hypothetical protein C3F13_08300 [Anaerolineales bacterium]
MMVTLTLGAGHIDRVIPDADSLLLQYRKDTGYDYLDYGPITPANKILPEDLAVTLLMNSRVGWRAFYSLQKHIQSIDLADLPAKPLENTSTDERILVAGLIAKLAQLPGITASVATKVLHKKRPALIPILDNQAIFGAYMYPKWWNKPARNDSVREGKIITTALEWIYYDLTRPENKEVWPSLSVIEPKRHRVELFDCVWWVYFRSKQPINRFIRA